MKSCPNCSADLTGHSCKLRCPRCNYFESCSDLEPYPSVIDGPSPVAEVSTTVLTDSSD